MIQIDSEVLPVDSENQKKHQIMVACFQLGGELADTNFPYMLHHYTISLKNDYRLMLKGNRQQKKRAEVEIKDKIKELKSSYKSLRNHLNKFSNSLGASYSQNVQKRESDISDAMYEFTDNLFKVK